MPENSMQTINQEEKNIFFSLLNKEFKIDGKSLIKNYINTQKLAWEQVLLLAIDCRQRGYNSELYEGCEGFLSKMKLIALTEKICCSNENYKEDSPDFELLEFVLNMLDNNNGVMKLTKQLLFKSKEEENPEKIILLLSQIENNRISFSGASTSMMQRQPSPTYSHYAMYVALYRPTQLFRQLLNITQLSKTELLVKAFISSFKEYIRNEYSRYGFNDNENSNLLYEAQKIKNITTLKVFLTEYPTTIDNKDVSKNFLAKIMEHISNNVALTFKQVTIPKLEEPREKLNKTVFQELCKVAVESNEVNMNFNLNFLKNLINLGQLDTIVDEVRSKLEDNILGSNTNYRRGHAIVPDDYSTSFSALGTWYQNCQTELFRKFEDIPRLIASILVFDIRHKIGIFDGGSYPIFAKLNNKELALLTTGIIENCLYMDVPFEHFIDITFGSRFSFSINNDRDENIEQKLKKANEFLQERGWGIIKEGMTGDFCKLPNSFMEVWAVNVETKPTLERIKKLVNFEKVGKRRLNASNLIMAQQRKGREYTYPINTNFPLPLWSSLEFNINIDEKN
ncbi:hypothetical protein H5201_08270 [Pseudoalteromonas sp. SG43-6]|uniref:hypothetical protein n=1 Tax=Pseudoalteromonas sp. SG43-6 TaxID=2760967 RepID=UPI00160340E3|nr:hypothetical protein [Pseudoalteromonas sp. SG43-6]MBB1434302.1 hypothetical protein [Pseudoalteromonas sp. SG43-6]